MSEVTRGLDREDEVLRNRIPPSDERFLLRQPVEGVVDLRGTEATGVVLKEAFVGEVRRVERTLPVIVVPAGRADVGAYSHHPDACLTFLTKPLFLHKGFTNLHPKVAGA